MMTEEQFQEIRQLLLDLAARVEAIELHLKRQDGDIAARLDPIKNLMTAMMLVEDEDELPGEHLQN
ncbi:hypothetical protein [Hoeflea alexandrii]|uniref:SlyX protein n=1 Tax=Hoeflea alexandrii TaxID=288436 RepID=A0ABT1CMA6_9HYPH|nr:hypothetical protein [Hoeflea alexandrii]MCO6407357.1 hypothetical protein [Hoeflea alexandrii]MCY0154246.1 hypothetical protein [Hoeflea alexandrii]